MIRTQIHIPERLHHQLQQIARDKGEPMANVARTFLQEGVERVQDADYTGIQTLKALAKLGFTGGPKDLSANIDHYLYGGPKKKQQA